MMGSEWCLQSECMSDRTKINIMITNVPLVLASGSPRRKQLLASLGVIFSVVIPDIDEVQMDDESPQDCVRRLSRCKARHIASELAAPALILAADTVVSFTRDHDGKACILSKPSDDEHAREILLELRGKIHQIYTGVSLLRTGSTPVLLTTSVTTTVLMRNYSKDEMDAYITTGAPLDKAGGYAIQDEVFKPVERIEGSYTNVVGLPLDEVKEMLVEMGMLPLSHC